MRILPLKHIPICIVILLLSARENQAQVLINEVAPSNISVIQNSKSEYEDWIEIINSGNNAFDLNGYGLTDDINDPFKFTFSQHLLLPDSSCIVFASGEPGEFVHHYEMAVNCSDIWKYTTGSASVDTNWRNISFNDAVWNSGAGGIGFSDDDDATEIQPSVSLMMRMVFQIADTTNIRNAIFMMDYDDGFVAYLNGVEIARANMGVFNGRPSWDLLASEPHEAQVFQGYVPDSFFVESALLKKILRQGDNVLAIETHDRSAIPTDMSSCPYLFFGMKNVGGDFPMPPSWFPQTTLDHFNADFKLSRTGETVYLIDPAGNVIDQVAYPHLEADHSYGRVPDGAPDWCYIGYPTPLATNDYSACYTGYATVPVFSKNAGFYQSTQSIGITSTAGQIRYSTNGNVPDSAADVYASPLLLSNTTTVRARAYSPDKLPSPVVTRTYFINVDTKLPVISITTDSLNLWDYNTGIYVFGPNASPIQPHYGANFWQPWQKTSGIEFFDKAGIKQFDFTADLEIYGNHSRKKPQKSFEISLKDKYGTGEISYPLISDKPWIDKYDKIILRNNGTDWNVVHFRDPFMQRLMKGTHCDYVAAEPTSVFLNGSYWGIYMIIEKHNQNWIENNYGYKKEDVDFLSEVGEIMIPGEGDLKAFSTMYEYVTTQSPLSPDYYEQVHSMIDLKNLNDYFIAETYYNNGDWIGEWTNNIKLWRPRTDNARWKYLLVDTDYGFGLKGNVMENRLAIARNPIAFSHSSEIFDALLKNPTFKRDFINRYADLINTIYIPSNVEGLMKQFRDSMMHDMKSHFQKWGGDSITWHRNIGAMMSFVNLRPAIMRDFIVDEFNLAGEVLLSVDVHPPGSGRIEISTVIPDSYPWSGIYFNGNPITITAIPNPGYTFDYWQSDNTIINDDFNQKTTYNFAASDNITAYFTGSAQPARVSVSEINYHPDSVYDSGEWIELHNYANFAIDLTGWKISNENERIGFTIPTGITIPPGGYYVIAGDTGKFRKHFPKVNNVIGQFTFNLNNAGEEIRLLDHTGALHLSFFYQDQLPWPVKADGLGYTCELINPNASLNNGANWFEGCFGGSPGSAYSNVASIAVPISGSPYFCIGGQTYLNIHEIPDVSYQWTLDDSNIAGANKIDQIAEIEGTYQVKMMSATCSINSDSLFVNEMEYSQPPVATNAERCGKGSVMLTAYATDSIFWYNAMTGDFAGTGKTMLTPPLSQTTTYFMIAGSICPSEEVEVKAIINPIPCLPSVIAYPNPTSGHPVTITSQEFYQGMADISVFDMQGRIILRSQRMIDHPGKSVFLNVSELSSGLFVVSISQGGRTQKVKLVLY